MKCQALRNIPDKKREIFLKKINDEIEDPVKRNILKKAYIRYFEANIPVSYWSISMENNFEGDKGLIDFYNQYVVDLNSAYVNGTSACLAGNFGRGKTLTSTCILKKAVEKGFSALYTTLTDITSVITTEHKYMARKELLNVDFLVIDEFDSRHIGSTTASSDFFGRVLEDVLRTRSQNALPLILCTNSPDPTNSFDGTMKESISSLWNYVDLIPVLGSDYREVLNK